MNVKKYNRVVIGGTLLVLVLLAGMVILVDPDFHYRAPLSKKGYSLDDERFQNDGIVRNFDYDAIITGTSVTQNFKTSECDRLFGTKTIKVSYSGGTYKEINDNLKRAFDTGKDIKMVVRSLDYSGSFLIGDKDDMNSQLVNPSLYPEYLYDNNIWNDVNYFLNKSMLISSLVTIKHMAAGTRQISFDSYNNWNGDYSFGRDAVLATFERGDGQLRKAVQLSESEKQMLLGNLEQNVIDLVSQYPTTEFYLFFPPYSICYWDTARQEGKLEYTLEAERVAIEELLKYDNIHLFSFNDKFDWTCNLDNYKDRVHYGEWINSAILECMSQGKYQLTADNYLDYLQEVEDFYSTYDYEQIYQ